MTFLLTSIHVIACLVLIAVVLLQSGKGAEMGASFGSSGSQSVFGAGGGTTVLSKITAVAAVVFMVGSLALAYVSGLPSTSSIMSGQSVSKPAENVPSQQAVPSGAKPAEQPAAPAADKK